MLKNEKGETNVAKAKAVIFKKESQKTENPELTLNQTTINYSYQIQFLGVIFPEKKAKREPICRQNN